MKTLSGVQSGISKECEYKGGGIIKYYSLESYGQILQTISLDKPPKDYIAYSQKYGFDDPFLFDTKLSGFFDEKLRLDFSKIYKNIDLKETILNLTGKEVKMIDFKTNEVIFKDNKKEDLLEAFKGAFDMVREQNLFKDEKKILLQSLAQKHKIELDEYELEKFSKEKSLLEYQQEALENAFSILNLYFNECGEDKKKFYEMLGVQNSLNLKLDKDDFLKRYFKIEGSLLKFEKIVNQMCFWMATGSGKTIVIIKLIEMLVKAMENGFIPQKDIFFFSANESLLEAFKGEVEAYNLGKNQTIVCHSLKDYENKNKNNINKNNIKADLFNKYIHIFFYNAYNLADESKDKQLDFKNVYNNGNNYVILDEAHKGNKAILKCSIL